MYTFMEVNELYERASLLPDLAPDQGWIGQSGQLHRGCDTTARRTWLTAEQAAERFNVTVREINERYRPIMELTYPGSVLPPLTEVLYEYDFEGPNFNWEGYEERQKELLTVDPYGRSFYCYPEMAKGFVPDEDEDGDALRLKAHDECGYDKGLEPKSRTVTGVVAPRLYEETTLEEVRLRRVNSRKDKPLPPRGKGGRFAKKAA